SPEASRGTDFITRWLQPSGGLSATRVAAGRITSRGCDHPTACAARAAVPSPDPSQQPTPLQPPTTVLKTAGTKPHRSEVQTLALFNAIPPSPPERQNSLP